MVIRESARFSSSGTNESGYSTGMFQMSSANLHVSVWLSATLTATKGVLQNAISQSVLPAAEMTADALSNSHDSPGASSGLVEM